MITIWNALLNYQPSIKKSIEMCKCTLHEAQRGQRTLLELILDASKNEETTIRAEGNILLWADLLGG